MKISLFFLGFLAYVLGSIAVSGLMPLAFGQVVPAFARLTTTERKVICKEVLGVYFKVLAETVLDACARPPFSFFKGAVEAPGYMEFAAIAELDKSTYICKVFSNQASAPSKYRKFEIENCTEFSNPNDVCSESIRVAVAKSLVRRFPTISHSFTVEQPLLKSQSGNTQIYKVTSTDETENERWLVKVHTLGAQCKVTSLRMSKSSED